ncbi:MAG: M48 family metallopeptidase [Pseudomonas sp.]|uniref:metalloprotease LoiP n=1 Tax=Pseudomonas sp. TaxID=306 RepID=UPI003397CF3F
MKSRNLLSLLVATAILGGCQNMDAGTLLQSGGLALQAATLSDAEVKAQSDGACAAMDEENKIAPAGNKYAKRLAGIAKSLGSSVDGTPINYKVYMTDDVNAWAMANGCVRVYSGLMDLMTDNEVAGVLGHEIGHVGLGHSKKAMQVEMATNAAQYAASASSNGAVSTLSQTQLGDLGNALVNSQFSQSQETDADTYSYNLLTKRKVNPQGLATAMDKLAKLGGGSEHSMFDSHPPSAERAQHIRDLIAGKK